MNVLLKKPGGLSPRVRGSLKRELAAADGHGSIPAGAGEPGDVLTEFDLSGVYPRGCGGATSNLSPAASPSGLSPRVRGSRQSPARAYRASGSIPAGAGEPPTVSLWLRDPRVYPRGCGGAMNMPRDQVAAWGLSPRVRGSLSAAGAARLFEGSIPAGAGEPNPNV